MVVCRAACTPLCTSLQKLSRQLPLPLYTYVAGQVCQATANRLRRCSGHTVTSNNIHTVLSTLVGHLHFNAIAPRPSKAALQHTMCMGTYLLKQNTATLYCCFRLVDVYIAGGVTSGDNSRNRPSASSSQKHVV